MVPQFARIRAFLLRNYLRKWAVLGVLIGIVAGLGAIAFYWAISKMTGLLLGDIAGYHPPMPRGEGGPIDYGLLGLA